MGARGSNRRDNSREMMAKLNDGLEQRWRAGCIVLPLRDEPSLSQPVSANMQASHDRTILHTMTRCLSGLVSDEYGPVGDERRDTGRPHTPIRQLPLSEVADRFVLEPERASSTCSEHLVFDRVSRVLMWFRLESGGSSVPHHAAIHLLEHGCARRLKTEYSVCSIGSRGGTPSPRIAPSNVSCTRTWKSKRNQKSGALVTGQVPGARVVEEGVYVNFTQPAGRGGF
ncbi:hypothetical protein C8Q76DRAFT_169065 [Earliella scabrosa]|nr:hypothetical protein C8Q76DRAFT_169065 [Earliella scabrosa]